MSIELVSKDALASESASWAARARGLQIVDRESCINASHLLKSIKSLRVEIAQWFAPHIFAAMETKRTAEAARRALVDEKDRMESGLVQAEGLLKRNLLTWETQQEQARQAHERALQQAAQAQAEAATLEAAAALEREAVATGNAAMLQEASDILAQPIEAPVVAVQSFMPKMQGVTYRDNWKAHPDVDVKALAAAVASGTVPPTYLLPNMPALNQMAKATQGLAQVPGVKFWNDRLIAAKG